MTNDKHVIKNNNTNKTDNNQVCEREVEIQREHYEQETLTLTHISMPNARTLRMKEIGFSVKNNLFRKTYLPSGFRKFIRFSPRFGT